jgi:hypothetical protein
MALLIEDATADVEGDASSFSSPCTVYFGGTIKGTSVVEVQVKSANTDYNAVHRFYEGFTEPVVVNPIGAYSIRAVLKRTQPGTDATVEAIES